MKVVNYEPKYYLRLLKYSKSVWPWKTEEYLRYRLFQIPEDPSDNKYNLLLINEQDEIVGCNLFIKTKAKIYEIEKEVHWSHDLYVTEIHRGLDSIRLILRENAMRTSFGIGSTEINNLIQKARNTNYISVANSILIFNIWAAPVLVRKYLLRYKQMFFKNIYPDRLYIGNNYFEKINNVNNVNVPNDGYWFDGLDIDFVRDKHYLQNRFFNNFNNYYFYKLINRNAIYDDCYFVVRPILQRGIPILSLVDFRFNLNNIKQFKLILKGASALAKMNRIGFVYFLTNLTIKKIDLFPVAIRRNNKQEILTRYPFKSKPSLIITNADHDIDFQAVSLQ